MSSSLTTITLTGLVLTFVVPTAGAQQVAEVQVSPPAVTLAVNQQGSVFATAYDGNGNVMVGQQFRWSSSAPNVVRVEVDQASPDVATLVGVGPGVAQIEARVGSRVGTAAVQVVGGDAVGGAGQPQVGAGEVTVVRIEPGNILLLPAESRQLMPVFLKDDGSLAAPTRINWRSLSPSVATVSDAGLIVAISEGQGLIEVETQSGLVARAPVQVSQAAFTFGTPVLSLSPGAEASVEVVVPSQGGRAVPNAALSWRSTSQSVVRVTPRGVATAVGPGNAQIVASGFLQEQSLPVTVHRPVAELSARPGPSAGPISTPLGGSVQLEVRSLAADGTPVPEAPLTWTVRDTTIASLDPETQLLSGLALGSTELHLLGPGPGLLEATWQVEVIAGGVLAIPRRVGLGVGDTVRMAASFTDGAGIAIAPATNITWSVSDKTIADVTGSGTVSAVGPGRAQIVASTPWDKSDTTELFVQGDLLISSSRGGGADLFALDHASPGTLIQLTSDPAVEAAVSYSPDGSRIAFVTNRDGNLEIYFANADGSDPRRVTTSEASEDSPTWTPDGQHIVYAAQSPGSRAQVWIASADGSDPIQLTSGDALNFEPAISPDGQSIAFSSTRDGNYEIYLMDLDGSNQRNVTESPGKESHAAWFPDGNLAFIVEQTSGTGISTQVVRKDLTTGEARPITPANISPSDFAISAAGDLLAIEVSEYLTDGGISRKIVLLIPDSTQPPVEVPRQRSEQHWGPSFRPRLQLPTRP